MINCPACGFANQPDSKFCAQCGKRLSLFSGDTTHIIPIVDDDAMRADVDLDDEMARLAPGTALLVVTRGMGDGVRYVLDKPKTTAGRSSTCDIMLDDITVSRHHVTFALVDGGVVLTDHGSLNGTYVNRGLINQPTWLRSGDEVQIGKFRMVVLVKDHGYR